MWRDTYLKEPSRLCATDGKTDPDLAGHFTVIKQCGIVLYGKPIAEVFGEVPEHYYFKSIFNDIKDAPEMIINQPTYTILNLCRVLGYLRSGKVMSKVQGAEWALKALDLRWHKVIQCSLDNYRSFVLDTNVPINVRIPFSAFMLNEINQCVESRKK
nr:DUF4111 domain-containing protein [Sporolactobacillus kofuensis]